VNVPPTEYVTPVDLAHHYSADRSGLPHPLRPPIHDELFGARVLRGMSFIFGPEGAPNVILLESDPVRIELGETRAHHLLLVHVVADATDMYGQGLADDGSYGLSLGSHVSDYVLNYGDGTTTPVAIRRRFAIQQGRFWWGTDPVSAVAAGDDRVVRRVADERRATGTATVTFGTGEVRHRSSKDALFEYSYPGEGVWIYALPNPRPEESVESLELIPRNESSVVYALSLSTLSEHPLRPPTRRAFRVALPDDVKLDATGEIEDVGVDLGEVLSARPLRAYGHDDWHANTPRCLPRLSGEEALIEVAAHREARLVVGTGANQETHRLDDFGPRITEVARPEQPVRIQVLDGATGRPVPVRLHLHDEAGRYLAPRGHHRLVNAEWFEDLYAEYVLDEHQYAYVDGECVVDLPLGSVYVEIERGFEISPIRTSVVIEPDTDELVFTLERALHWRERGWVTADTHVHFLSPQTALLEGRAEDIHVVNLLASQWGEMFSNVGDFDGRTTLGARELGGDGEFLVRVGTEDRMQRLGHLSLLGYVGPMIHPLCTGGPSESALGDPLEVSMAEWAEQCRAQQGLVVMPHAPLPQLERAADFVLGLVDANEMLIPDSEVAGLNPYGIADWYRYLSLGYQVPVVGGTDKMSAAMLLGEVRTYANLGEREFEYSSWMDAIKGGDTFVTLGPLVSLEVEGVRPGGAVSISAGGGTVSVSWEVDSVRLPVQRVEIVVGGTVAEDVPVGGLTSARGSAEIRVHQSTWIAARVRSQLREKDERVSAHTSAVFVLVGERPLFSEADAADVLDQIEAAIAYVDTLAPRAEARRLTRMRATLVSAYNRLHDRMHREGHYHRHVLHDPTQPHEH
jgi:hypothetical protein